MTMLISAPLTPLFFSCLDARQVKIGILSCSTVQNKLQNGHIFILYFFIPFNAGS